VDTTRLTALPRDVDVLSREAEAQGYRFLRRLIEEWNTAVNRFDQQGEVLFAARVQGQLVGVGGLNRDPYSRTRGVGRVRHLYVLEEFRHQGIGTHLLERIVAAARGAFNELHLRTDSSYAGAFYERFGFRRINYERATHALTLGSERPPTMRCRGRGAARMEPRR
jgi:N-acetylglutamate synthase-like GNAT family acetyltransferase